MNYYQDISKEEELARFEKAAIAHRKKVTASKEAAREFLIAVGVIPPDYPLPKASKTKAATGNAAKFAKAKVAETKARKAKAAKAVKDKSIKLTKAKTVKTVKVSIKKTTKAEATRN